MLRRCAINYIDARNWLCKEQSLTQLPVSILGLQGTCNLISVEHQWLRPRDRKYNPSSNPNSNVQNGFFHFCRHNLTHSGEYNLGLLTNNSIKLEEERGIFFYWLWQCYQFDIKIFKITPSYCICTCSPDHGLPQNHNA